MIKIVSLAPEKWRDFRDLRLEALREEPLAFGSSLDEEKVKTGSWERELKGLGNKKWYFSEVDGDLVGMAAIKFSQKNKFKHLATLVGVYVKKDFRGRGIARLLTEKILEDAFKTPQVKKIRLLVNASQKPAVGLYEQLGFKVVGRFRDEFFINGIYYDALAMEIYNK